MYIFSVHPAAVHAATAAKNLRMRTRHGVLYIHRCTYTHTDTHAHICIHIYVMYICIYVYI